MITRTLLPSLLPVERGYGGRWLLRDPGSPPGPQLHLLSLGPAQGRGGHQAGIRGTW